MIERYTRPQMGALWSDKNRFRQWFEVELAALQVLGKNRQVPRDVAAKIRAKAKINVPFGATLSRVAKLPPGSRRDSSDQYAEKGFPWRLALGLFLLIYMGFRWYKGSFDRLLPEQARPGEVLGNWAPQSAPAK